MNKNIVFVLLSIVLISIVGAGYYLSQNKPLPEAKDSVFETTDITVSMGKDSYTPQNFQIKKGTKVTFVNDSDSLRWPASDLHPSHLIYSDFDPKQPIEIGGRWTFEFDKAGEWGYHDHLAPYITGTIKVVE